MKEIRDAIRAIIQDDALYKRRDLPGDLDDPEEDDCECDCDCDDCSDSEDYVTPKYALYSLIESAIDIYDRMDDESFEDETMNQKIFKIAEIIRRMKFE